MSQLDEYLTEYIAKRALTLEKYVLEAYNSADKRLLRTDCFQGTLMISQDLKDCEFLKDTEIFTEEVKLQRKEHNNYRVFRLTQKGLLLAKELKNGLVDKRAFAAKIFVN